MAARPAPKPTRRRAGSGDKYVTRREFAAVLAVIEKNTIRIERLEDVFAMQALERGRVKHELGTIKAALKQRQRRRRRQ